MPFFLLLVGAFVIAPVLALQSSAEAAAYRPPVEGVVTDDFRSPSNPYGPGNRGWEYSVAPGSPVFATADGVVTFAGQVGGTLTVVVQHDDGIRTTASKLTVIAPNVAKGATVIAGQLLGTASGEFYFGARCGSEYIDPQRLFESHVFLVSLEGPAVGPQSAESLCDVSPASSAAIAWATGSSAAPVAASALAPVQPVADPTPTSPPMTPMTFVAAGTAAAGIALVGAASTRRLRAKYFSG